VQQIFPLQQVLLLFHISVWQEYRTSRCCQESISTAITSDSHSILLPMQRANFYKKCPMNFNKAAAAAAAAHVVLCCVVLLFHTICLVDINRACMLLTQFG
jgi:hypothetical protein